MTKSKKTQPTKNNKKLKILAYCDSPTIETGFAQLAKPILKALHDEGHEVIVVGVNHKNLFYDKNEYPYMIVGDTKSNLSVEPFMHFLLHWDYDVLFTSHDFGVLKNYVSTIQERRKSHDFRWVAYMPMDSDFFSPENLTIIEESDAPYVYTKYGVEVIAKLNPKLAEKVGVMYLPNTGDFKPIDSKAKFYREKIRQDLFKVQSNETFVVMNLNRNHSRKDPFKTLQAFAGFAQNKKNVLLYLHMQEDRAGGAKLNMLANALGIADKVRMPTQFEEGMGFPRSEVPKLYQGADVVVSTTKAEGWGYSATEAMASKTAIIMPNHTSLTEMLGAEEERGYLVAAGMDADHWVLDYSESSYPHPIVHLEDMIANMEMVYADWQKAKDYKGTKTGKKIEAAYKWVNDITWDRTTEEWLKAIKNEN